MSQAINASKNRSHFKYTIGGHGPAADPQYFLNKTGADVVGIGEGEITFVELMEAFAGKRTLESIDGIAFIDKDGRFVQNKRRELIQNINEIAYATLHIATSSEHFSYRALYTDVIWPWLHICL